MRRSALFLFALATALPFQLAASEWVTARLVFDKSVKLKKIDASLYVPFAGAGEQLRCGVIARGKNGRIAAAGSLRLRLVGETANGSSSWESAAVSAAIDQLGDATFDAGEIAALADTASADGAEARFYRVDFAGGKGGRVAELTMDCLRDRGAG